jgi:uncharacterized coiled-coil protein SlyX
VEEVRASAEHRISELEAARSTAEQSVASTREALRSMQVRLFPVDPSLFVDIRRTPPHVESPFRNYCSREAQRYRLIKVSMVGTDTFNNHRIQAYFAIVHFRLLF